MYMKSIYLTSLQTKSIKLESYNGINNNTIQFIITDVLYVCSMSFQKVKNLAQPYRIHMVVPLDL